MVRYYEEYVCRRGRDCRVRHIDLFDPRDGSTTLKIVGSHDHPLVTPRQDELVCSFPGCPVRNRYLPGGSFTSHGRHNHPKRQLSDGSVPMRDISPTNDDDNEDLFPCEIPGCPFALRVRYSPEGMIKHGPWEGGVGYHNHPLEWAERSITETLYKCPHQYCGAVTFIYYSRDGQIVDIFHEDDHEDHDHPGPVAPTINFKEEIHRRRRRRHRLCRTDPVDRVSGQLGKLAIDQGEEGPSSA